MQEFSTNLGLSILPELDQKDNPEIFSELLRIRNALRALQSALDVYTGALSEETTYWSQTSYSQSIRVQKISRIYCITSEAISYGQLVNLYDVAGVTTARKADATDASKPCRAYCNATVASGAYGEFILFGYLPTTGAVAGTTYYLDKVAGLIVATAPVPPPGTVVVQRIGFGLDATSIWFNPDLP